MARLVAGLSSHKNGFGPGRVHVGFVVDELTLGHVLLRVPRMSTRQCHSTNAPHLYH